MTVDGQTSARTKAVANSLFWLMCSIIFCARLTGRLAQSTPGLEPPPFAVAPLVCDNDHSGRA